MQNRYAGDFGRCSGVALEWQISVRVRRFSNEGRPAGSAPGKPRGNHPASSPALYTSILAHQFQIRQWWRLKCSKNKESARFASKSGESSRPERRAFRRHRFAPQQRWGASATPDLLLWLKVPGCPGRSASLAERKSIFIITQDVVFRQYLDVIRQKESP